MGYDDDRERRRNRDDEYRRGDFNRCPSGAYATGWPGETSWGYGREYDERCDAATLVCRQPHPATATRAHSASTAAPTKMLSSAG